MLFNVQEQKDINLKALAQINRGGGSVVKTPHVGNWYPNNLAVAQAGIHMLAYDRNIGHKDSNFHPHKLIKDGSTERIGCPNKMCTHLKVKNKPEDEMAQRFFADNVAKGHIKAIRAALPEAEIETFTDYLQRHRQEVLTVIRKVTPHYNNLWERKVLATGEVFRSHSPSLNELQQEGIYGLTDDQEGWIIPLEICVLLCGVLEAVDYGVCKLFHLSGPDMKNYVGSTMREQLNNMYELTLDELSRLPQKLEFNIVPVSHMRLAVPTSRQEKLDGLVESYLQLQQAEESFGSRIQSADPSERSEVIREVEREREEKQDQLRAAVKQCPEVFYNVERGRYFSQYDILEEDLYLHPWGLKATMKELKDMLDTIDRYCDI